MVRRRGRVSASTLVGVASKLGCFIHYAKCDFVLQIMFLFYWINLCERVT
jgi:hypothetical protein